jgi:hypothetical protein
MYYWKNSTHFDNFLVIGSSELSLSLISPFSIFSFWFSYHCCDVFVYMQLTV